MLQDITASDRSSRLRLIGFGLFSAVYFLSYFQRVAISAVADDLAFELRLDSVALGFMSSGFLISYALTQPIMGFLCDRIGPERVSAIALILAAIGSFMFGKANGFGPAFLGRIIMGVGLSAGLIPGMKFIAVMFPPEVFTTYNALFVATGNIGALVGAAPLVQLSARFGWRSVFTGLAVASVSIAGLCLAFTSKQPSPRVQAPDSGDKASSYRDVIKSPHLWLLSFYLFGRYGAQIAFQGLWGIPYLTGVYGVDATSAAGAVGMIAIGIIVASPIVGKLADTMAARGMGLFAARRRLLVSAALCYVATWIPLVLAPGFLPFQAIYVLLFIMGMCTCTASLVFGIVKDLFRPNVSGFASGLVNIICVLGGVVMPPVVGWFVKRITAQGLYGGAVYSKSLVPCLVASAAGAALILIMPKPAEKPFQRAFGQHTYD